MLCLHDAQAYHALYSTQQVDVFFQMRSLKNVLFE